MLYERVDYRSGEVFQIEQLQNTGRCSVRPCHFVSMKVIYEQCMYVCA